MNFYYNPLDRTCKSVTGALARGSVVNFRIYKRNGGEEIFSAETCYFVYYPDGGDRYRLAMKRTEDGFSITLKFNRIGLYFYRFEIDGVGFGCGNLRNGVFSETPSSWQITVFDENYKTPDWMKGGVMYQIFPDRFYKSGECPIGEGKILRKDWGGIPSYRPNKYGKVLNNDFFGGNLSGIREKIDYLKSLGVTVLYLNPIFEAYSNHRYDTGDYMKIDSLLGTTEDFDRLIEEAKKKGIRIVLDGVFNHTGDNSRYFNRYGKYKEELGAFQSTDSPYFEWYRFRAFPNLYDSWWGIETLPAVNEASPSYQEFILGENGVIKTWMRHGIGGFRIDVADELPDFFLKKLREAVKTVDSDGVIIGEVWEDASNKIAYNERREYLQGFELDSVMNYPLMNAIIEFVSGGLALRLRETVALLMDNYPKETLDCLMNILGTHDTSRILTALGGKPCVDKEEMARTSLTESEKIAAREKLKMAAFLQFMLPGVPCVYYGDENGMEGYRDPFCRRCFDWDNIDVELNEFYKKLGKIRTELFPKVFQEGSYREVFADDFCIVFERKYGDESIYAFVNNSSSQYNILVSQEHIELFSEKSFSDRFTFGAYSYGIICKK